MVGQKHYVALDFFIVKSKIDCKILIHKFSHHYAKQSLVVYIIMYVFKIEMVSHTPRVSLLSSVISLLIFNLHKTACSLCFVHSVLQIIFRKYIKRSGCHTSYTALSGRAKKADNFLAKLVL